MADGLMGSTHIRLAKANEDVLTGACAPLGRFGWKKKGDEEETRPAAPLSARGLARSSLQSATSRGVHSCTIFPNEADGESFGDPLDFAAGGIDFRRACRF